MGLKNYLIFSYFGSEKSEKIQKRASNVMKLAEENKNLEAELKALTDRLEAAEKRAKKREGKPYGA